MISFLKQRRVPVWAAAISIALLSTGCVKKDTAQSQRQKLRKYASLPGLQATHHQALRDEWARIVADQATPDLLQKSFASAIENGKSTATGSVSVREQLDDTSTNRQILALFQPSGPRPLRTRLRKLVPTGRFEFDAVAMYRVNEFLREWEEIRSRFRVMVNDTHSHIEIRADEGTGGDWSIVDAIEAGIQLEGLFVASQLYEDNASGACDTLAYMFRGARMLSKKPSLYCRLAAANLRLQTLRVLEAIVHHPTCDATIRNRVSLILTDELVNWDSDRLAWLGERANGLLTYELIRDGHVLSVLEFSEYQRVSGKGEWDALAEALRRGIDDDELFYLDAMRTLIEACDRPYFQRLATMEQIRGQLDELRNTTRRPFVADQVLLKHLEDSHRLQATDLAGMLAWKLAIDHANGVAKEGSESTVNPLTGEPFDVESQERRITVGKLGTSRLSDPRIGLR